MSTPPERAPLISSGGFALGCRTALTSVFGFVIAFTYIGFGALCHDYGLSMAWAMLSTALQWAGPAQIILVTGMGAGAAMFETAVAVCLSSVRLLPIVVALMPVVKSERTRPWQLIVPAHFMAISVWIESMRMAPSLSRDQRVPFCNGVGITLLGIGVVFTAVGYTIQALLPAIFAAGAMFMTPISFLVSAARNARLLLDKLALGLGLVLGPAFAYSKVEFDLLWAGIIAGTAAYAVHRMQHARSTAA